MEVEISPETALLIINERKWECDEMEYLTALAKAVEQDEPLTVELRDG